MDPLLPTLLLTTAKEKFKFNRQLRTTDAETESKFKKKVLALKLSYKKTRNYKKKQSS